jgi:Zn-dependent peptidase ImmA (M78 family)/transcriptional regulator with XRE-family HTH domain
MRDLSQTELATICGMTQGSLSKIEQGLREPTEEMVSKLAISLRCEPTFFYQAEREYGAPLSAHPMFRKKASVGQKILDRIIAELNVRIAHIRTFISAVDLAPELPLPQYDPDEFAGDVAVIAEQVRRAWLVPRGPIKSLTEFAERAGCLVVHCDMEAARIDGVSYRIPGLPPIIFLNRNQPSDRMRFSLAHEIGHLVMHAYPIPEMEKQADQFASALLMPAGDIGPELSNLTLDKAAYMKPVWQVSMASLIYRASTLQRIDKNKSEYLWRQMAVRNFRLREPASVDFAPETTSVMNALVANMTENMGYTREELSRALHLFYDEIAKMYSLQGESQHPGLRLVK